jgi:uncharacterized membrane protein YphA (DoxX/SURF4 family)
MTTESVSQTGGGGGKKSVGRYVTATVRILLGLMFLVFGLNGFLNFMPAPKDMPEHIGAVVGTLTNAGYLKVACGTMVLSGVLLLVNLFVPLALAFLAPIIVGILTFHIFVAPSTIGPAFVVTAMELYLALAYRHAFYPMLRARVKPGAK